MRIAQRIRLCIIASLVFFQTTSLIAQGTVEENFVVKLSTESLLAPLYLLPLTINQSELSDSYVHQLEQVLIFDLNQDSSVSLAKRSLECNQIGSCDSQNQLGTPSRWRDHHIHYVVKAVVQGQSIIASMLDIQGQFLKKTNPVSLTGNLGQDRRQIHLLADSIHKALLGDEGVASTRILYTMSPPTTPNNKDWISEVWESDYDGGNARKITQNRSYCITPVYLPPKPGYQTGGFIYVSYQLGQPKIYIRSLKDGKSARLTYLGGNQLTPAIAQQRDKVAFVSDVTGSTSIFIQNFSPEKGSTGKPQQVFSSRHGTQGSPAFSPNGKQLAFVSDKDGSPKIYIMDILPAGTALKDIKLTLISKRNRENSAPSWSPDGKKLAYCAKTKGDRQIWFYDFDTNQEIQLTHGAGHKENPSWGPDSQHLIFNTADVNSSELFIMHLNQAEPTKITFGSGLKCFPNWEPRYNKG